ncbi:hypothetical protein [Corynebacterium striatum]|uniref:hypothetical protein n=1 Tax=Corynebacterium striatum TaxID=43770 RepID=UPI0015599B38|nr:hypothetical protein [Corynebacterium striatum]
MKCYATTILNQTEGFTKHQLQMMLCTMTAMIEYYTDETTAQNTLDHVIQLEHVAAGVA